MTNFFLLLFKRHTLIRKQLFPKACFISLFSHLHHQEPCKILGSPTSLLPTFVLLPCPHHRWCKNCRKNFLLSDESTTPQVLIKSKAHAVYVNVPIILYAAFHRGRKHPFFTAAFPQAICNGLGGWLAIYLIDPEQTSSACW